MYLAISYSKLVNSYLLPGYYNLPNILESVANSQDIGFRFIQCTQEDPSIPSGYEHSMGIGFFYKDRYTVILSPFKSVGLAINTKYRNESWKGWKIL